MDFSHLEKHTLKRRTLETDNNTSEFLLDSEVSELGHKLMLSAVIFHKLHLKVSGDGSFAAHKALNELYDALPEHADNLIEGYQGAVERIIECSEHPTENEKFSNKICNSVEDALSYIRELVCEINELQSILPYSEIVNELDNVKSTLNSAKYKLNFLK